MNSDGKVLVADSGELVNDELAENLFSPFVNGDSSRRSGGGSGLGLSLAYKIMKKHGGNCADAHSVDLNKSTFTSFPQQAEEFASFFSEGLAQHILKRQFISTKDGLIFMLPDGFAGLYRGNIRYVRTGTCFGSLNRSGKFTAHTAFALTLKADDFTNVLDLRADDPCVIKYLKGETLTGTDTLYDLKKGYVLVCVDHHPLGFANYDGKKLKNFYEKGWIYK